MYCLEFWLGLIPPLLDKRLLIKLVPARLFLCNLCSFYPFFPLLSFEKSHARDTQPRQALPVVLLLLIFGSFAVPVRNEQNNDTHGAARVDGNFLLSWYWVQAESFHVLWHSALSTAKVWQRCDGGSHLVPGLTVAPLSWDSPRPWTWLFLIMENILSAFYHLQTLFCIFPEGHKENLQQLMLNLTQSIKLRVVTNVLESCKYSQCFSDALFLLFFSMTFKFEQGNKI